MNRLHLSILFLFILIVLLNLPVLVDTRVAPNLVSDEFSWQANYRANQMQSTLYNKQGLITHKVFANTMEHFEELGFTIFSQPRYTIYTEKTESPWEIDAEEGTLYEDNRIQLERNVHIKTLNEAGFVRKIETSFIEINLTDKTMTSDQPVVITGEHYVIQSNGFAANLLTRKFELLDHVQTAFNPTSTTD